MKKARIGWVDKPVEMDGVDPATQRPLTYETLVAAEKALEERRHEMEKAKSEKDSDKSKY